MVAVVLPELWCELVELTPAPEALLGRVPLGVVLGEPGAEDEIAATSRLEAVNARAHRLGIRPGQTLAQARALVARFEVRRVSRAQLEQGLGRVAEIAFTFGTTVAIDLPDTVWVDVTGGAHLFGGESALVAELGSRVRAIGHRARVALADGPRLAQAFARYGDVDAEGSRVVPSARTQQEIRTLPVRALPLPEETLSWFVRLGVLTFADWNELPKSAVGLRLGVAGFGRARAARRARLAAANALHAAALTGRKNQLGRAGHGQRAAGVRVARVIRAAFCAARRARRGNG